MREINLEGEGACLFRDNDEKIDPDKDFSHIDKRIEDVLGHYQKDFMGEVTADILGSKFGGYGSFLPVDRSFPLPNNTRPQTHISSRSPQNQTTEVHQSPAIQTNESMPVRLRPGIPPPSRPAASVLDNAVDVRSSGEAFLKNQPKTVPPNHSDNNLRKVRLKVGADSIIDNSAIYSGLGLDISPSSSPGDGSLDLDGTPPCIQGLPEKSPSHIIKLMTSLPIPDGKLLSPLSEDLFSLMEKEVNLGRNFLQLEASMKTEHESISSEGKMSLLRERKVKQINKNKVSEFERENCEDSRSIIGHCSKRMEESKVSKGKEIILENSASAVDGHYDRKDPLTITGKDKVSSASFPFKERNKVEELVDVGPKLQKQSNLRQGKSIEQVDSLASPVASSDEKGNRVRPIEKIQRDKNVNSVMGSNIDNDELSQTGYLEQTSKKSKEEAVKKKVKKELPDSFSSHDAGMQHQHERMMEEDTNKFTKEQRKMKDKVKTLPDSAFGETGTYHERTPDRFMEKKYNARKASLIVGKDVEDKQKHGTEDSLQGMKDLDWAAAEPLKESSSEKNLPHSQMGANLHSKKEPLSSEGKKKGRKSHDGSQSTVVPRVSFKVGSCSVSTQQADHGSSVLSQGERPKERRKVKHNSGILSGKAVLQTTKKVTAAKDPIAGVAKRENHASAIKLGDKSDDSQSQNPSNAGSNRREDLTNISHSMEKAPASAALTTEIAPVLEQDNWVQCDKCQTWRLLPHNIKTEDLPKRWLCSMLTWLPGMNNCSFTEAETRDALLALYQPLPLINDAKIHQTYPNTGPSVFAADTQPVRIPNPATGLDAVLGTGKRRPNQEVHAKHKKDQPCAVESGNKQKLNQLRTAGAGKSVVLGKKREDSKDTHGVIKKVKRDPQQFAKDLDPVVPLLTESEIASFDYDPFSSQVSKDFVMGNSNTSKKFKDKSRKLADTNEDERKDVPAKKRKPKDLLNGAVGTETPSCWVPLKESVSGIRKEKRQKLESHFSEKESSTTRANDKIKCGNHDNISCGGVLPKAGRREDRPLDHNRNMPHNTVDGKKWGKSDPELKMPALAAATSSSSKVSSSSRVKVKSQAKDSPVGSISSSPLKLSRTDHDRSRNQICTPNTEQELSSGKKNLEARIVASGFVPDHLEKTEGKSKKETDPEGQFHPAQEEIVKKTSALNHVDERRRETQLGTEFKEEESSSCREFVSADQPARCLNVKILDKTKSVNIVPEGVKPKQDRAGSSRDTPCSSTQELEFEKGNGCNAMASHDSKGKLPKQLGSGDLVADDAGASSSVRKDNSDWAARAALKEATDLKHFADRLKISGSGGTLVFFQAALKFLQGASLLESGNTEGSRCGDMKSSEVYSSTAKLCHYCAHEFEKSNDMASAALAYKCMEVAYMRVVYADDVAAGRDRHELQQAQTAVPQVESPSSSASDVDNVNNPTQNDAVKATQSPAVHGNHVISAVNRPSFVRLLKFAQDVNLAMDAARKSQSAFAAACVILGEAGNEEGISSIRSVLDFSFHDVDKLLHLIRLAMEAFSMVD